MGMKRLGFGSVPATSAAPTSKSSTPDVDDAPTTARERFGNQKAISSDMFFSRGAYDPQAVAEGQARLAQFQGATSISSSQYFGRDEEEEMAMAHANQSLLGDGSLAGFETAARDAVARVMANPDVQQLSETLRTGALKVRVTVFGYCWMTADRLCAALGLSGTDGRALRSPLGSHRLWSSCVSILVFDVYFFPI